MRKTTVALLTAAAVIAVGCGASPPGPKPAPTTVPATRPTITRPTIQPTTPAPEPTRTTPEPADPTTTGDSVRLVGTDG